MLNKINWILICTIIILITGSTGGYIYLIRETLLDLDMFKEVIEKPILQESEKSTSDQLSETISEIIITSPRKGDKWEIGRTYRVNWTPNNPEGFVVIKLYNRAISGSLGLVFEPSFQQPNTGTYSFYVNSYLKPGDLYQFLIHTCIKPNSGEESYCIKGYSGIFSIISK